MMIRFQRLFLLIVAGWLFWPRPAAAEAYVWRNVVMRGGGFVSGLVYHPTATNLLYARTDVGGAYRWDDGARQWIPLTDWIGPEDGNLMGIESIALDPSDPRRVYLAAGTYSRGKAAILRSADQGRTFERTEVTFGMGGNEVGRFNGERLAVDPHAGAVLFFGSRRDGLWQSRDSGVTWQKVDRFPEVARMEERQAVGIVSVVFDPASGGPGRPTPKLFAAVSTTATNLFFSTDGGVTWQAVAGQPVGLRPNHLVLSPEGMLYLSYGREPGPNGMSGGAVWRFDPQAQVWTDITPLPPPDAAGPFGYGAVAVDAQHPATVMVTTFAHWQPHDLIFRSPDGGAHWAQVWREDTVWDSAGAPYTQSRRPHWMGSMVINPRDSDQVWLTTGFGVWCSGGATQAAGPKPMRWEFMDAGLEETVPLALISPPAGAHLLSGVGDVDGFVHADPEVSPAAGSFAGPRFGNTEALAFAGGKPQVIVRTGTGRRQVRAAYSLDGGNNWQEFRSEPPQGNGAGAVAISADAGTVVWTPQGGPPYVTRDWGAEWQACAGLATGLRVVADAVQPQTFYAFNPRSGRFYVSTNAAAGFAGTAAVLAPGNRDHGVSICATPGKENDVWLVAGGAGLRHSTNGGTSFTQLASVQVADSLGLGKAPPGKTYPALYLAGKVGELRALFRSDDQGVSWVRLNDDRHQYGWIGLVTGDPRIYGRVYLGTGGRGVIYGEMKP